MSYEKVDELSYKSLKPIPIYAQDGMRFVCEFDMHIAGMHADAIKQFHYAQRGATCPCIDELADCHYVWDFESFMKRHWPQ